MQLEWDTWYDTMKEMDRGWTWKDEDSSSEEKCVTRIMAYSKVEKRGLLMIAQWMV